MARPRRGTLKRRPTKQGISYGVAFTYRGHEFYEHFGGEWEGWDEERAEEEQRFLMEKVNRGEWTSAKPDPASALATDATDADVAADGHAGAIEDDPGPRVAPVGGHGQVRPGTHRYR